MGLIRTTIKYGVPVGFVYWTVNSGEWRPMEPSEDLKKTRLLYRQYDAAKGKVEPYIKPYLPEINIPFSKEDLIKSYNEVVKNAILSMSHIDVAKSVKKLLSQLDTNTQDQARESKVTKATSETKV